MTRQPYLILPTVGFNRLRAVVVPRLLPIIGTGVRVGRVLTFIGFTGTIGNCRRGASVGIVIFGVVVRLIGNVETMGGGNSGAFGGAFFCAFGGAFFLVVLVIVVVVDFFFFAGCFLEG
jgi:hypothetical protein